VSTTLKEDDGLERVTGETLALRTSETTEMTSEEKLMRQGVEVSTTTERSVRSWLMKLRAATIPKNTCTQREM
jgi:hypothetical protein